MESLKNNYLILILERLGIEIEKFSGKFLYELKFIKKDKIRPN